MSVNRSDTESPLSKQLQRFGRTGRVNDGVSEMPERFDGDAANPALVLDHQYHLALLAAMRDHRGALGTLRCGLAEMPRQVDLDRRADARFGIDLHVAAGLPDKTVDLAQAEAGALADFLGGEEGIEGLGDDLLGHADAVVAHRDLNILPGRDRKGLRDQIIHVSVGSLDREPAAVSHRIAGIDAKVEDGVFKLARIGLHLPEPGAQNRLQADGFAERPAQQIGHTRDHLVRVQRLRRQRLLA